MGQVQGRLDLGILLNRLMYQNSGLKNNIFSIKKNGKNARIHIFLRITFKKPHKFTHRSDYYNSMVKKTQKKTLSKVIISKIFFESAGFI